MPLSKAVSDAAKTGRISPESIEIRVTAVSAFSISASLVVGGRQFPAQHLDSADRAITASSIDMLASALAAQLATPPAGER
jgi:hypothetical protein